MRGAGIPWPALLGAASLAWSAEVALARLSGLPLPLREMVLSALVLAVPGLAAGALAGAFPLSPAWRARAFGLAAALPAAGVACGIAVFALDGVSTRPATAEAAGLVVRFGDGGVLRVLLLLGGLGLLPLALGALLADPERPGRLAPWLAIGPIAAAALVSWWLGPGELAPARLLAALGAAWLGLGVLASRPRGGLAVALAALLLGLLPRGVYSSAAVSWTATGPAPDGPDLVLLVVDTLRADLAGEMRSYQRLARDGVSFTDVVASAPWTLPSMATLLTGLPVSEHAAGCLPVEGRSAIAAAARTLAERFAAQGWDTAAVVGGNPNVGPSFGFARGFAVYEFERDGRLYRFALPSRRIVAGAHPVAVLAALSLAARTPLHARVREILGVWDSPEASDLVDRALGIWAARRDRPLFLWLHTLEPHLPYRHAHTSEAPAELHDRLTALRARELREDRAWATPERRQALWAAYRHEVERVDRELLRLLDGLGPAGPRGRIVVLTSDHGEEFLEHGRFEHGHSLHQELLAVPLVVSGVEPGEAAQPVGLVDVAPTLLARAGLAHDDLPGRDLLAASPTPIYVAQNLLYADSPNAHHAVRRGRWKLVASPSGRRLYDLEADPGERSDRAAERPDLAAELGSWEVGPGAAGPPQPVDRHEAEALRELGYLE